MYRYLFFFLFQLPVLILNGQTELCNITLDQHLLFEGALTGQHYQMKRTIGNQLYLGGSFPGDIILTSGDTVRSRQIGYNSYHDDLIWAKSGSTNMIKIDREEVERFLFNIKIEGQIVAFRHLRGTTTGNKKIDLFAQILVEGPLSLYVTRNMHIVDKTENEEYGFISYIERIEPSPSVYYINLAGDKFKIIKSISKKSLYEAFPEQKEAIRTLLLEYSHSLRKEKDLINAVGILNKFEIIK